MIHRFIVCLCKTFALSLALFFSGALLAQPEQDPVEFFNSMLSQQAMSVVAFVPTTQMAQALAPTVDALDTTKRYEDADVGFMVVDTSQLPQLKNLYNLPGEPIAMVFDQEQPVMQDGRPVMLTGSMDQQSLQSLAETYLGDAINQTLQDYGPGQEAQSFVDQPATGIQEPTPDLYVSQPTTAVVGEPAYYGGGVYPGVYGGPGVFYGAGVGGLYGGRYGAAGWNRGIYGRRGGRRGGGYRHGARHRGVHHGQHHGQHHERRRSGQGVHHGPRHGGHPGGHHGAPRGGHRGGGHPGGGHRGGGHRGRR